MNHELAKTLTTALVQFIDSEIHEIRDVDYDIHIDTSANGSFNRLNIIQNEK